MQKKIALGWITLCCLNKKKHIYLLRLDFRTNYISSKPTWDGIIYQLDKLVVLVNISAHLSNLVLLR